jgi:hypothetical protein
MVHGRMKPILRGRRFGRHHWFSTAGRRRIADIVGAATVGGEIAILTTPDVAGKNLREGSLGSLY